MVSNLVTDKMEKQFVEEDEVVMVQEYYRKLKPNGQPDEKEQEKARVFVMTFNHIYTFKDGQRSRLYKIKDVGAILVSTQNQQDFMLFFEKYDDLHASCKNRKDLLDLLKLRYNNVNRNITLRVYGVTVAQMATYMKTNSSQNKRAGVYDLPEDSQRLLQDEIKGEEEYNASLRRAKGDVNQAAFEAKDVFGNAHESTTDMMFGEDGEGNGMKAFTMDEENDFGRQSVLVGFRSNKKEVKYEDFKLLMMLGRGTFGKVFLAELQPTKALYAIKAIRKDVLIEYNQVQNTKLEKDILFSCDHPFLVGMDYLFQSPQRLYFVMPFIKGGELYKIFKSQKRLSEDVVKFYAAQICMAVGYLHSKGIMHRDLKLENILVDNTGYLKIIDYGLAKTLGENQTSKTFCGTPEYLAPEMVMHQGHDFGVDWWALGILIYEMLIGVTPFYNKERKLLLLKIRQSKVVFPDKRKYKIEYSDEFVDLVLKLLNKDKKERLGSAGDAEEILKHPFFASLDLEALYNCTMEPPLKM